ncbi:MAG: Nif3-like dinuclear metal center hexameric protein [bacterium]
MVNVLTLLESLAPPWLACEWDNSGLQVGNPRATVNHILLALTPEEKVVAEAISIKADLIITHHPLFFSPIKSLTTDNPTARIARQLISSDINLYCAHTNLDASDQGVSQILAERVGLENLSVLDPGFEREYKLVVFVPEEQAGKIIKVMEEHGGKPVGNYTSCTFRSPGTGTYRPGKGARPYKGVEGELSQVPEVRLETLVAEAEKNRLINAIIKVHPYEEAALDVYPLKPVKTGYGFGRLGDLSRPVTLAEWGKEIKEKLDLPGLRMVGNPESLIKRVAVVGGSGGDYIKSALARGAEALITGDVRYHQALEARASNLAVLDIGHFASESMTMNFLFSYLKERLENIGSSIEISLSRESRGPFNFYCENTGVESPLSWGENQLFS